MNTQAQTTQQSNNASVAPAVSPTNPITPQTSQTQTNQQSNNASVAPAVNPNTAMTPVSSAQITASHGFLLVYPLVLIVFYNLLKK